MTWQWRDQWTTTSTISFGQVILDSQDRRSLYESFTALGVARVVAGARALYMQQGGWRSCFLALAYGDAGKLQRAISPNDVDDDTEWSCYDQFCGKVGGLCGIDAEHVRTIVSYFDGDKEGFMAELRRWLQDRGASVVTVLAEAEREAEAQPQVQRSLHPLLLQLSLRFPQRGTLSK